MRLATWNIHGGVGGDRRHDLERIFAVLTEIGADVIALQEVTPLALEEGVLRHAREALALIRDTCREPGAALLLVSHDEQVLAGFDTVVDLASINRAVAEASTVERTP